MSPIFAIAKLRHAEIAWQYESDKAIDPTIIVIAPSHCGGPVFATANAANAGMAIAR
jgi:hypothetical protein